MSANHDGSRAPAFASRVLAVVRRIPAGRVSTYGDVAALAGRPLAWRAVGNIMRECDAHGVPCHRVVGAGGRLGGYGDLDVKRGLLAAEGIRVTGDRLRGFAAVRWQGPDRPGRDALSAAACRLPAVRSPSRRTARGGAGRRT